MRVLINDINAKEQFKVDLSVFDEPLRVEDYSERSVAVFGCTREFKTELSKLGGEFNAKLTGGAGWIFSKKKETEVIKRVSVFNKLAGLNEISVILQDKPTAVATRNSGDEWQITQVTDGTFHLHGNTRLFEDELISLGCQKIEDNGEQTVWYFTKNKLKPVSVLVSAINKLIKNCASLR